MDGPTQGVGTLWSWPLLGADDRVRVSVSSQNPFSCRLVHTWNLSGETDTKPPTLFPDPHPLSLLPVVQSSVVTSWTLNGSDSVVEGRGAIGKLHQY